MLLETHLAPSFTLLTVQCLFFLVEHLSLSLNIGTLSVAIGVCVFFVLFFCLGWYTCEVPGPRSKAYYQVWHDISEL